MFPDLQHQIVRERQKRDRALRQLENSAESAADGIAGKFQSARTGMIKGVIRSSPWASCFAALGAGALLGKIASGGGGSNKPQRVVIEVQGANGAVAPAAPPAPAMNPLDMIMQALTVYGAVQQSLEQVAPGFFGGEAPPTQVSSNGVHGEQEEQNEPPQNNV